MREIIYKYNNQGAYYPEQDTVFGDDKQLKLITLPHDFSISIGNETLRKTSFGGGEVVVSCNGEAVFYDTDNNIIAKADKGEKNHAAVRLLWKQGLLTVEFGSTHTVDYYPNCDGEHDRWGEEWVAERTVELNLESNAVEIK